MVILLVYSAAGASKRQNGLLGLYSDVIIYGKKYNLFKLKHEHLSFYAFCDKQTKR